MGTILQVFQQRKTLVILIGGIILGLILGLVYAWVINPVKWTNTAPNQLRSDFQKDYIAWIAEEYASTGDHAGDIDWASKKLGVNLWDEKALAKTIEKLAQEKSGEEAVRLRALAAALNLPDVTVEPISDDEIEETGGGFRSSMAVCGVLALVISVVLLLYLAYNYFKGKQKAKPEGGKIIEGGVPSQVAGWETTADGPPLAQFSASYALGDDHYDPSFSIELENGEFLGECGMGISERIGVDTPNKITAFEIWLFDKSDIRTVTKVLMSEYAFNDEALRAKLAPKGEPILAQEGQEFILETKTIRLRARVMAVQYGDEAPTNSFFKKLAVDLAAWSIAEPSDMPVPNA